MGLKKGMTNNPNGRPAGSQNKLSAVLREDITDFLDTNFETIKGDFKKLKPRDRVKFYTDLLQFAVPKLQAMQLETQFDKLTDDQLDYLLKKLTDGPQKEN